MKYHPIKILCLFVLAAFVSFAFTKICLNNSLRVKTDTVLKVYKDQKVTAFFKRETGWIAADGAYTVPLDGGNVLWTFGDSFTNDYDPATGMTNNCLFNVRSSMMLQPFNNWDWHKTSTILSPTKSTLFHSDTTPNHFNWPAAGVQLKDTAYIYCFSMKNVSGGMGFANGGPPVFAKVKLPEMKVVGYHILQDFNGIEFGLGIFKNTDGYVYVYGSKGNAVRKVNCAYVARFPMSRPNADWKFWDGKGWNADVKTAAPVGENENVGVNVNKVKNKYVMFTTELSAGCDMGRRIYVQVSDKITGPFTKSKLIWTLDDTINGHYPFFYATTSHPEYINNKDELLVTYSINGYGNCVPGCINHEYNPDFYRPRGIRIPLKLIDPSL